MPWSHIAFSDESIHEDGQYRSLSLITLPLSKLDAIDNSIQDILEYSGIENEYKWNKLGRAGKYHACAKLMHSLVFEKQADIRVDILVWDITDSRHNIYGRDDNKNIGIMYYRLISNTFNKWPSDSTWIWKPDKNSVIDWRSIGTFLVSKKYKEVSTLFNKSEKEFRNLKLQTIRPCNSCDERVIQLADHFAGLGAYSYGHFNKFKIWKMNQSRQLSFFESEASSTVNFSNREKARFPLMDSFNDKCKEAKMQIAFDTTRGFQNMNSAKSINFWMYKPQHEKDKAPIH